MDVAIAVHEAQVRDWLEALAMGAPLQPDQPGRGWSPAGMVAALGCLHFSALRAVIVAGHGDAVLEAMSSERAEHELRVTNAHLANATQFISGMARDSELAGVYGRKYEPVAHAVATTRDGEPYIHVVSGFKVDPGEAA